MEDIRTCRSEEEQKWPAPDDERAEWNAAPPEDEVPFHIPRD